MWLIVQPTTSSYLCIFCRQKLFNLLNEVNFQITIHWSTSVPSRDTAIAQKEIKYFISASLRIVSERILLSNWEKGGIYYIINLVAKILCQYCDISLPQEDLQRLWRYMHPISEQSAFQIKGKFFLIKAMLLCFQK